MNRIKIDRRNWKTSIACGATLLAAMFLGGTGCAIWGKTLVAWWLPVVIALILAGAILPVSFRLWGRLTDSRNYWLNGAVHMGFAGCLFYFLILFCNYQFRDIRHQVSGEGTVERKYSRHHTSGGGTWRHRRSVHHYNTYHYLLALPDGRLKEMTVTLSEYNHLRKGSHIDITLTRGLFGMEVINCE